MLNLNLATKISYEGILNFFQNFFQSVFLSVRRSVCHVVSLKVSSSVCHFLLGTQLIVQSVVLNELVVEKCKQVNVNVVALNVPCVRCSLISI